MEATHATTRRALPVWASGRRARQVLEYAEIVKCCDAEKLLNCGGATAGGGKVKLKGDAARIGDVLLMLPTATYGWRLGTLS